MRGLTYFLRGNLYLAVTNRLNSASIFSLRGPSFVMPTTANFSKLQKENGTEVEDPVEEPTSEMLVEAVEKAFDDGLIAVSDMDSAPITFAGYGEPLLRSYVVCDTARLVKEKRHGVPLRLKTNGLVALNESFQVAAGLKESGVDQISIGLQADNPVLYKKLMHPQENMGFSEVCNFVIACVEAGLEVECKAVEAPGVNISAVRQLSISLGAHDFNSVTYHP